MANQVVVEKENVITLSKHDAEVFFRALAVLY